MRADMHTCTYVCINRQRQEKVVFKSKYSLNNN